jgi:hypothetical protein
MVIYKSPGIYTIDHTITIMRTPKNLYRLHKIKKISELISSKSFDVEKL